MIYLYLWRMSRDGVGHLSLELTDGTYISFWPADAKTGKGRVDAKKHTYRQDVIAEGRNPDETLDMPDDIVDQHKIKVWWNDFVDKNKYHMLGNNCALVVKEALEQGKIYQTLRIQEGGRNQFGLQIAPAEVFMWAQDCKRVHPSGDDKKCVIS